MADSPKHAKIGWGDLELMELTTATPLLHYMFLEKGLLITK